VSYNIKRLALWGFLTFLTVSAAMACLGSSVLKILITKRIALYTGRAVLMNGPVIWHLMPSVGLELYNVQLGNRSSFNQDFLSFQKASIQTSWKSMITGPLKVDIHIDGLDLKLARNIFGQGNWDDLKQRLQASQAVDASLFATHTIHLSNSTLTFEDPAHHQHIRLENIALQTKPFETHYTAIEPLYHPLTLSFQWNDLNHTERTAALKLETQWRLHKHPQAFDFRKMLLTATMPHQATTTLSGDLKLSHLQGTPQLQATVQMMNIPFNHWLKAYGWEATETYQNVHLKTAIHYQYPTLEVPAFTLSLGHDSIIEGAFKVLPHTSWVALEASGTVDAKNIALGTLPINTMKTSFDAQKGLVVFDHLEALTAGIQHQGHAEVDLRKGLPEYSLSLQSHTFDLKESLGLLHEKNTISGHMEADSKLWTEGKTLHACLENLQGHSNLHIKHGKIHGISLMPLLEQAQGAVNTIAHHLLRKQAINIEALLTAELGEWKQQAAYSEKLYTPFEHFESAMTFKQGTLHTNHFTLSHPRYKVYGKGFTDLKLQQSNYETFALLEPSESHQTKNLRPFLEKTPLSIHIKGPLDALMIRPELGRYADNAMASLPQNTTGLLEKKPTLSVDKTTDMEKLFGTP
jgi:AsmA-like C-terminal region/AsmA family